MSMHIPESDWRRFRELRVKLLERYCSRVLQEVAAASQAPEGSAHERYLHVFGLVRERDRELADAFDAYRRSTAIMQLQIMRRMGLLTEEELGLFSEETRAQIVAFG
jgi:hypothetical protein